MYVTNNTTNDYDIITDYDNCTNNEDNFDVIIPTLLLTIPCGQSFLCLMSMMVYTLIKPLFNNKEREAFISSTSCSLYHYWFKLQWQKCMFIKFNFKYF